MAQTASSYSDLPSAHSSPKKEAYSSGVSWGAMIAGAFAMAALSLILLALGTGMGVLRVALVERRGIGFYGR